MKINLKEKSLSKTKLKLKKSKNQSLYFISSGDPTLNLALTGRIEDGYPVGRIVNVKGVYSSGKSLCALEAINEVYYNQHIKNKLKVAIRYNDAENALDLDYAEELGVNLNFIELTDPPSETVEEWHYDLWNFINSNKDKDICLYIIDSLDTLSDKREKEDIKKNLAKMAKKKEKEENEDFDDENVKEEKDAGGYGAQKAKFISKLLRDLKGELKKTNCILLIISQLRDDLKSRYGNKSSQSGGRGLPFYSTQVLDIDKLQKLYKTEEAKKEDSPYGRQIKIKIEKNKVYSEGRSCKLNIIFNHGFDKVGSVVDYLIVHKAIEKKKNSFIWNNDSYVKLKLIEFFRKHPKEFEKALKLTQKTWNEIEKKCSIEIESKWKDYQ